MLAEGKEGAHGARKHVQPKQTKLEAPQLSGPAGWYLHGIHRGEVNEALDLVGRETANFAGYGVWGGFVASRKFSPFQLTWGCDSLELYDSRDQG